MSRLTLVYGALKNIDDAYSARLPDTPNDVGRSSRHKTEEQTAVVASTIPQMPFFSNQPKQSTISHSRHRTSGNHSVFSRRTPHSSIFHRKDRDRVAGGYKAALANPNTTRSGRKHAKRELKLMGRSQETHVPIMTRIKRTLGIRSTPRRRVTATRRR